MSVGWPPDIPADRLRELMRAAVREATRSRPEDERLHPKVGAVLTDLHGQVLQTAFRGEVQGAHAEYLLLDRARADGVDLKNCVLFTTLEPCIHRGQGKIPCAQRIAAAQLAGVYIGTLDPNPEITGRGEMFLSYEMPVERFEGSLADELRRLNSAFFEAHRDAHVPAISLYASQGPHGSSAFPKPSLARDRNNLLQQTLDLISGDAGPVSVISGDLSWYREAQITFLGAALDSRAIRIVASRGRGDLTTYQQAKQAALGIGASLVELESSTTIRGTVVSIGTDSAAMVLIDAGHASLLRYPDDEGLLGILADHFETLWASGRPEIGTAPEIKSIDTDEFAQTLRSGVSFYRDAEFAMERFHPRELLPLTPYLERFKLFRVNRLEAIRTRYSIEPIARVEGSPWPITPPIVERRANGDAVIIDGAHRVYMALRRGDAELDALVVDRVDTRLPATPLGDWEAVSVYNTKLPRERRYSGYAAELFRPIRDALSSLGTNAPQ